MKKYNVIFLTSLKLIFVFSLLIYISTPSFGDTIPSLPQIFIQTDYNLPTGGQTISVNTNLSFQAALDSCNPGDVIELQAGTVFTGPFILHDKGPGTEWIYIVTSAYSNLPSPCNRVSPSDNIYMPVLTIGAGNGGAINTDSAAHHYRFVGIEFRPVIGNYIYNIIYIGNGERTEAGQPNNLIFDRCYVHGDPVAGSRRGILANGAYISVIDSYISDCKEDGADSQALASYSSTGPIKIVNNYLEGAGENLIFGGADPSIPNAVPSDIEIRLNYFFKPLSWKTEAWDIKNLLEFKNAQRVLVEGNTFENCWPNAQSGFAILFTPRNQNNTAPWSVVQDITFRYNKILNSASGINISGYDAPNMSQRTSRLLFKDNFLNIVQMTNGDGRMFQVLNGPTDIIFDHNTGFCPNAYMVSDGTPKTDFFIFRNNLVNFANYGFIGSGTANANTTLAAYFNNNWVVTHNVVIGGSPTNYPVGSFFPADTTAVQFEDVLQSNYRLRSTSPYKNIGTDSKDAGADFDSMQIAVTNLCGGSVGVNDFEHAVQKIILYPIPSAEYLNIYFDLFSGKPLLINVYDLSGRKLISIIGNEGDPLNISFLQNGIYLLVLQSEKKSLTQKFIVQNE